MINGRRHPQQSDEGPKLGCVVEQMLHQINLGEEVDLEALVRDHPDDAVAIRCLHKTFTDWAASG